MTRPLERMQCRRRPLAVSRPTDGRSLDFLITSGVLLAAWDSTAGVQSVVAHDVTAADQAANDDLLATYPSLAAESCITDPYTPD